MTLYELGEEYLEQAALIREKIRTLRPKLQAYKGCELLELRREIASLYQMALDCRKIGEYLKTYYD